MGSTFSLLAGLASVVLPGSGGASSPPGLNRHLDPQEYAAVTRSVDHNSSCSQVVPFLVLFGSNQRPWNTEQWQQVSDTVRGGSSQAKLEYLDPSNRSAGVSFQGRLDTTTLGGAGFASQAYRHPLSIPRRYSGFFLQVEPVQAHHQPLLTTFTFGVKNRSGPAPPGSELIYQCDFSVPPVGSTLAHQDPLKWAESLHISIPFHALVPTFRGRPQPDPEPFSPHTIAEISIMCRSFFDRQSGQFHLNILSLGLQ